MKTELKPCPFCGCSDVGIVNFGTQAEKNWRVLCNNDECMCMVDFVKAVKTDTGIKDYFPTKKEVIDAWNRRADDDSCGTD